MIAEPPQTTPRRGYRWKLLATLVIALACALAALSYFRGSGATGPGSAQAIQNVRIGEHVINACVVSPGRYRVGRRWTIGERLGAKIDERPSAVFLETKYKEPDHVVMVNIGDPILITENVSASLYVNFLEEIEATQADGFVDVSAEGSSIRLSSGSFVVVDESALVNTVTWRGVERFCEWLSEKLGRRVRPLAEAEWLIGKELYPVLWPDSIVFDHLYDVYSSTVIQHPTGYPVPVGTPPPPGAIVPIPPTAAPYRVLRRTSTRLAPRMPGGNEAESAGSWIYGLRVAIEAE